MNIKAERFFREIRGKRISVVGIGETNTRLVTLLCQKGAEVTVHDRRSADSIGEVCKQFEAAGAKLRLGDQYLDHINCEILFRTPAMYYRSEFLNELRKSGVTVTSEMEVFYDLCPCRTFAITGSDGKTTTSTLIAEMLKQAGYTVHLGGNIGRALLPEIEQIQPDDMAVTELSSFQLLSMRCAPDVSVVTNIAPNHLDVHHDMKEYIDAKRNIFLHQNAFSRTVLNRDNEITRNFEPEIRGHLYWCSRNTVAENGSYLVDGELCISDRGRETRIMRREDIRIPGEHNVENMLTAAAAVWNFAGPEEIRRVAESFNGVEHRIETVRELNGVRWINDSIATSPTRTIAGLKSFQQKLILIAGGYDKKIPFLPLAPEINRRVKVLILMGATADKIEQAVKEHPSYQPGTLLILRAENMEEAVRLAFETAKDGDIVSLSPACASFDQYPNFEDRGRDFKRLVNLL